MVRVAGALLFQAASAKSMFEDLKFLNEGVVNSSDAFSRSWFSALYLECENCTKAQYSWAIKGANYLFQETEEPCSTGAAQDGYDRPGGDLSSAPISGGADACAERCCGTVGCAAYVFATAPAPFGDCEAGDDCCYLKGSAGVVKKSSLPKITTATVSGGMKGTSPPMGMRSAVPLGGVGAGSFEIRADGTVKEVTIINQSPGGAAKMGMMDGFIFAAREESSKHTRLLRTKLPADFPAEATAPALSYKGSYPVTKLQLLDPSMKQLDASLFAFSRYRVNDLDRSTLPAVALSLEAHNRGSSPETAEFLVTLPLAVEEHYARSGSKAVLATEMTHSAVECLGKCQSAEACVSWMWDAKTGTCSTMGDAPLGAYEDQVFSGIKGIWSQKDNCLTLNRPQGGPAAGNVSLCVPAAVQATFATGSSPAELYKTFAASGNLDGKVTGTDAYGAVSLSTAVPAGSVEELSVAFSWYFPARDYMDQVVGNFYATQHNSSADVGSAMLADLQTTVQDLANLQKPLLDSTLPEWLTDTLHNSVSHIRSAWLESNREWRQWEAYDCVNVDSIHNDGERHIPYIMFMPETTRNKMHAWGATQQANGMLPEQLACGCMGGVDRNLDKGCGRVMSDVSSMYVVYLLELYKWANDVDTVKALWPVAKRAAQWHLDSAAASGVPEKQCNTYDILGPQNHKQVSYNSAFHLLGLRAAEELARSPLVNDIEFADTCAAAFKRGQQTLDSNQWIDRGAGKGYYSFAVEDNSSLMVDTFYPQVLSYTLGLGPLVNEDRLRAHLQTEVEWNDSPYGLVVHSTGGGQSLTNGVWQMGSPNWGALNLHLGLPVKEALSQPEKSLGNWREELRELWNVAGIADQDSGLPSITSHYGYYMTAWHLIFALSGQQADLPTGRLSFEPKLDAPYAVPVLLPGTVGLLTGSKDGHLELELTTGSLKLQTLEVAGCTYQGAVTITAGKSVTWSCSKIVV